MSFQTRHLRALAVAGIAIVVMFALSAAMLAFQARAAVERIAAALKPRFELTYSSPRVGLDGDLSVRDFGLRPVGEGNATLAADRAVLRSPGAIWFISAAFGSGPLPPVDRVGLVLEGASIEGGGEIHPSLRWIGARSAAPFEAAGCGTAIRFGADDWQQLALRTDPGLFEAEYAVTGPGLGTVTAAYTIPGSSRVEHRRVLKLPDPRQPLAAAPAGSATVESQWRIVDDGFVAARNRLCGRRAQVARNLFADQHVAAVQAWLRRLGLAPSAELVETYRRYALRGGELRLESRPRAPIGFASYTAATPIERARALGATLQATGKSPVRFELTEIAEPAIDPTLVARVDGAPIAAPDPAAPDVATTAPDATSPVASDAAPPTTAVPAPDTTPTDATSAAAGKAMPGARAAAPATTPPAEAPPAAAAPAPTAPVEPRERAAPAPPVATTSAPPASAAPASPRTDEAPAARDAPALASTAPTPAAAATPTPAVSEPPTPKPKPTPAAVKPPTVATAKPAPPRAAPVRRGVAEYATLERAVGMRIAVRTVHDTRRIGVLREWTGAAVMVELTGRDGGMNLKIPKGDIVAAEILDTNAVPPRAHAEKN